MKQKLSFTILFVIAFFVPASQTAAQSLTAFTETASFKLYKNESQIGTIQYSLDEEGNYQREFKLSMAGQEVTYHLKITPDADGNWMSGEIITPTDTVIVNKTDDKAEYAVKEKKYSVTLRNEYTLYDSYGPVFESFVLKTYDMERKGIQVFPRFLFPAKMDSVTLEYKGREIRTIDEAELTFLRYDLILMSIKLEIWADEDYKIYMMNVPVQYAAYVREGFDDLMKYRTEDPLLSRPEFEVRKETVSIPMRDGVKLAMDLYLPKSEQQKFPVVLIRTPYKKEMGELDGNYYSRRGYAVAIQDCRGRFGSEGVWEPFVDEANDGYDTVEWLGTRDWSNGKVGMIGASYVGWVQLWAASANPPHLATIIPNVAPPDPFYNIPYEYGVFFILGSFWWAEILETEATGDLSGKALSKISERKYEKILKSLPVIELDKKVFEKENPYWRKWIENNVNNDYWAQANFMDKLKDLDIPVFLQSGWFDGDAIGTKLNYLALKESKNKNIKMIVGPWGHTAESSSRIGEHDFGQGAAIDLKTRYLKWFDYWLKGIKNDILEEPLVQVFTMFSNEWLKSHTYPLPQTQFTKFYLSSTDGANTSKGDGKLLTAISDGDREFDEYVYDPGDPTPYPQYYFKSEEEVEEEKIKAVDVEVRRKRVKAFHNKVTDSRSDILVYRTDALLKPLTIAGPVSAVLYASTSAVDTDWFVTLMDVDEKGEIFQLARGTIRARFRNSMSAPELLEKNKIYEYTIDLWHTGITFQKGHWIRIEVSSALFPMFSRNLNTGGHNEMETEFVKAEQKIYHSQEYPSHLLLPVVKLEEPEVSGGQE
jgi:putative CocE/NonD family hydrolase